MILGRECVAILVDGAFYLRRAHYLWGEKSPKTRAEELVSYCNRHLKSKVGDVTMIERLYRIFYYDCPPSDGNIYNPILKKSLSLKQQNIYKWATEFHEELRHKRKVALRFGTLGRKTHHYFLSADATKRLLAGTLSVDEIQQHHLRTSIIQKGVDMRIGLDIASMAYKKQVTRMVLISGDSDFVPAAKLARREGIDFILDNLYATITPDLEEHIDGKYSKCKNPHTNPMAAEKDPLAQGVLKEMKKTNDVIG